MAKRYKWDSPGDWLGDKINEHKAVLEDFILRGKGSADDADKALAGLCCIANGIVNGELGGVDSDSIQDAHQDEMEEDGYFRDLDIAANLTREQCVELLEGISIECRDDETVEELRETVQSNIEDDTLDYTDVEAVIG
jgi:hypothetical protein